MDTHVKVVAILNIIGGAFGLLGALVLLLIVGGGAAAAGVAGATNGDPGSAIAVPIIGITGLALVTFLVILSAPGIVVGIGLLKFRPWARICGIVLAALSLVMIPFGTIFGIYALWVLFSKDAEKLFAPPPAVT